MKEKFIPMDPELVADGLDLLSSGQAEFLILGEVESIGVVESVDHREEAAYYAKIRAGFEPLEIVNRPNFMNRLARAIGRRAAKNSVSSIDQRG